MRDSGRSIAVLLAALVAVSALPACGEQQQTSLPSPASDMVWVDSVPRGATVVALIGPGLAGEKEQRLGTTPLSIRISELPSRRLMITMDMDHYVKAVESVPALKRWAESFRRDLLVPGGTVFGGIQHYFEFGDTHQSITTSDRDDYLATVSPIYELMWPEQNRLVGLFLPRGIEARDMFPLMPPPQTLAIPIPNFDKRLVAKYGFTPADAGDAVECLSRCGKFQVTHPERASGKDVTYTVSLLRDTIQVVQSGP